MTRTAAIACILLAVPLLPFAAGAGGQSAAVTGGTEVAMAVEIMGAAGDGLTPEAGERDASDADRNEGAADRMETRSRAGAGGAGGFTVGYLNADFGVLNDKVRGMGIPPLSEDILLLGGRGYGRIGCLIIGGAGYGGATETSGIPDCCSREAKVEMGYGGMILGLNKGTDRVEGTLGALIGGGGIQVARTRNSRSVADWDGAWAPFEETSGDSVAADDLNMTSMLTGVFFALEPYLELRVWVLPWMSLDFAGSYLWARISRGQWKVDGVKIPDSPETNIGGMSFKFTLNFGA